MIQWLYQRANPSNSGSRVLKFVKVGSSRGFSSFDTTERRSAPNQQGYPNKKLKLRLGRLRHTHPHREDKLPSSKDA